MLYHVMSGDGIVSLDLAEDSYFCRYKKRPAAQYCAKDGRETTRSEHRWTALPADRIRISPIEVARFLFVLVRATARYRGKTLKQLIEAVQCAAADRSGDEQRLIAASLTCDRLIRFLPVRPECLFRSFLLLEFLKCMGLRADWVFAVHLFPFRAHCWVAKGALLLNEQPHRIETYQPILVAQPVAI
jgi:hypothetical protein